MTKSVLSKLSEAWQTHVIQGCSRHGSCTSLNRSSNAIMMIDLRSLALFRILLGMYLLVDIFYGRLALGKYDLAWYTEEPVERSYLNVLDTRHYAPLHRLWFYRGSIHWQLTAFYVAAICSFVVLLLGFQCNGWTKAFLWMIITSQVSRNSEMTEGSDGMLCHLLLWTAFLPVAHVWSLDAHLLKKRRRHNNNNNNNQSTSWTTHISDTTSTCSGLPCFALKLQLALVYWGTVLHRTVDQHGWSIWGPLFMPWKHEHATLATACAWLPPHASAMHYILNNSYATRDTWLTQTLRHNARGCRIWTVTAIVVEMVAPVGCLFGKDKRIRLVCATSLFALHTAMYVVLRLSHWQWLGMLVQVLWIPDSVWNVLWPLTADDDTPTEIRDDSHDIYKKTDGDENTTTESNAVTTTTRNTTALQRPKHASLLTRFHRLRTTATQVFFFVYMIYNWCGYRGWIPKHDGGDIGEGLRLSQNWMLYGRLPYAGVMTQITGTLATISRDEDNGGVPKPAPTQEGNTTSEEEDNNVRHLDVMHYISTRGGRQERVLADNTTDTWDDMAARFPSPRWENVLHKWGMAATDNYGSGLHKRSMKPSQQQAHMRAERFLQVLCVLLNEDITRESAQQESLVKLQLRWHPVELLPPGSPRRYGKALHRPDQLVNVTCI